MPERTSASTGQGRGTGTRSKRTGGKTPQKPKSKSGTATKATKATKGDAEGSSTPRSSTATVSPGTITNYSTAVRWLMEHTDHERLRIVRYDSRTFSLERMRRLLSRLGNPHQELPCVHVAGTKGKGSTCAMLASMLQACGYSVGLYSSPHLVDLRERITIDGRMISYQDFTSLLKEVAKAEGDIGGTSPTYFEVLTAMALRHFSDQAVDIAILETGLGGRLDATNVVTPMVCGVTHISLDHTNILGDDITQIAREKAGIFKKGVPAVSVGQDPAVDKVLCEIAEEGDTTLEVTGREIEFSYRFEANRELGPHTRVCINTPTSRWEHLPVPLQGEHQAHNCGLALAMLDRLKAFNFEIPQDRMIVGLAKTELPGRMELVHSQPRIVVDGAHNAASIQALIRSLGAHIAYDSLVLIFGCGQDKDSQGMLKEVALGADKIIFTRARAHPRAMEPKDLYNIFNQVSGKMSQTASDLREALRVAGRAVSREDLIVVTGSFYIAGEAKKYLRDLVRRR